ncbi:hypothetical protein BGZ93_005139 [Podila epicladia]|nr:hypothetical protein BGZ92_007433 [Podila epicladia]KAG0096004.1 hypothetical protein BGZ93_005139 [Podila epicladia]
MAPSCAVDPLDCILYQKRSLYKRAPEGPPSPGTEPQSGGLPEKTVIIIAASVGSVVLILALALFYICMRRRRASRRIGQLAQFLPTFMDKEKTEKYFQAHGSSSTLVPPPEPSNVHHRARSAPIAFAKGVTDHRNRQLERDASMGQFQQISLISEDTIAGDEPRRSLSGSRQRASSGVATPATPIVVSSLHRSVSLNKHERSSPTSRTAPTDFGSPEGNEIIPGPNNSSRFAEGEPISRGSGSPETNRYSAILDFKLNQGISPVDDDYGGPFDPARFSTASVMFDAKRLSNLSNASSDDSMSTSSTDDMKHLPPHQMHHSFHSHHTSPVIASMELNEAEAPEVARHTRPVFEGGEKQEILDEEDELKVARLQAAPSSLGEGRGMPDKQEYDELEPVEEPMPPPRIVLSQPHGQDMSP